MHRTMVAALVLLAAVGVRAQGLAALEPAAATTPQYFMLDLPAGASLISSPLDTGQGLAIDAFQGLPPAWPLFWGWDSPTQDYEAAGQAPMRFGAGYWVFSPVPTTLAIAS